MAPALTSIRQIEREVTARRIAPGSDAPYQRTSVMTHTAWVPPEWVEAAEDVLAGLAERHPSRTIVLFPQPDQRDGLDADVDVEVHPVGADRYICTETIRVRLNGPRAQAPASVVQPLLLPDLPVFLRWRGVPPYGDPAFEGLIDVVDRLIVDSTEWDDLPAPYAGLAEVFDRVVVSDIAWARTSRWRTCSPVGCARAWSARSSSSTFRPSGSRRSKSTASRRGFRPEIVRTRPTSCPMSSTGSTGIACTKTQCAARSHERVRDARQAADRGRSRLAHGRGGRGAL
jgi:hypothetical protein